MEIWAHCAACDRWFYCPVGEAGVEPTSWHCPVCGAEPRTIENRAAADSDRRRSTA